MACTVVLGDHPLINAAVAVSAHIDLAPTPSAAPAGRHFVREQLEQAVGSNVLDDVLLLSSELVTNAVLHARTSLHLGVTYDEESVLVTVKDESAATPRLKPGEADESARFAENGRGMALVAGIAHDFGWLPVPESAGKVTWFVVGRTDR